MNATRRSLLAVAASIGVLATGCAGDGSPTATRSTTNPGDDASRRQVDVRPETPLDRVTGRPRGGGGGQFFTLAPFSDCSAFLDHVKAEARERVGPYGLDGSGYPWGVLAFEEDAALSGRAAPAATEAPAAEATASVAGDDDAASGDAGASVTGTNTQEEGVDEPDIVKADGSRIITVSENVLTYVDITGDEPVVAGTLTIPEGWGHQLFLHGDRAVLLSNSGTWGPPMPVDVAVERVADDLAGDGIAASEPAYGWPAATVVEVDLSQPSALRIASTLRVEGQYLNAREIDGRLLLVMSSGPQWMPWLYPQSPEGEERAREANQQLVDESTLADWVPQYELSGDSGSSTGDLLDCARLNRPAEFSGFDVIAVVDIDLGAGVEAGFATSQPVGVLAGGQTVYASLDRLYVATTKWLPAQTSNQEQITVWSEDYETELHSFAIPAGAPVEYVASGSVEGSLLSSFSLDEHNGFLRVLTTDGTPWDQSNVSETMLTVFQEQGDLLVPVGEVGGLGRGEALYSARLIGDRGFAVTFRQVDPFYVLDLSDPAAPRVTGELKIPGFSTYLHPVGEHRVLGVGRSATDEGQVTGLKLSLFDVSDPANPVELSTWTLDDAQTAAEYDHHAFQMIGSTAILPVQSYGGEAFNGAIVFEIGDAITELGRITHEDADQQPVTDCHTLQEGDVPDTSPAYWLSVDPYTNVQICGQQQAGGFGDWYCDVIPVDQVPGWFGYGDDVVAELAALNGGDMDRLEMCYPQDAYLEAIQRSIVIDGTLWTLSAASLRAHDLATLTPLGGVDLR